MKKVLLALMLCSILSGCASIIKGRYKTINVMTSTGEDAEANIVSASGMQTVTIPGVVTVKRDNQPLTITVKESKCTKNSTTISSDHLEMWFWGNVLTGGFFGSTTDAVTGSMWTYDDNIVVPVYKKETCNKQ